MRCFLWLCGLLPQRWRTSLCSGKHYSRALTFGPNTPRPKSIQFKLFSENLDKNCDFWFFGKLRKEIVFHHKVFSFKHNLYFFHSPNFEKEVSFSKCIYRFVDFIFLLYILILFPRIIPRNNYFHNDIFCRKYSFAKIVFSTSFFKRINIFFITIYFLVRNFPHNLKIRVVYFKTIRFVPQNALSFIY